MNAGPAIGRHRLGVELRQLRTARSLRLEDVAAKLGIVPSTLCRIETGQAPTKINYLCVLFDLYGIDDAARRDQMIKMAEAGRSKDWWADYASLLPAGTGTYLSLEAAAERVQGFAAHAVPGFLQTPGYAEAFIKATQPYKDTAEVSRLVTLHRRRQRMLHRDGRRLDLVLDESILLRAVGSARVMAGQLAHLLTFAADPLVTLWVIRLTTVRPMLCPSFTLLSLPDFAGPGVACVEGIGGQIDVSRRAADVDSMQSMFEALATSALSPAKSAKLIGRYADSCA